MLNCLYRSATRADKSAYGRVQGQLPRTTLAQPGINERLTTGTSIVIDCTKILQSIRRRSTGTVHQAGGTAALAAWQAGRPMAEKPNESKTAYRVYRTADIVRIEFVESHVVGQQCVLQLRERLGQVLKRVPDARIVLDLKGVQYVSSAALGELLSAHKHLTKGQGKMCMASVGPELMEILATTRLDAVFETYDTADGAIRSFAAHK